MEDLYKFTHSEYITTIFKTHNDYDGCEDGMFNENDKYLHKVLQKDMYSVKNPMWTFDKDLYSEEDFVENYANPLTSVRIYRPTVVVTKDDKKVAIKFFEYSRTRLRGTKYFRVSTSVNYITFNYLTHSLYSGFIINYHKKRKFSKKVKRNCFYDDSINRMSSMISAMIKNVLEKTPELLINNTVVNDVITHFIDSIPNTEKYKTYTPPEVLFKLYLDGHKIKTTPNWNVFMNIYPQPKKKDYVKHKLKFMDTFMSIHDLRGDKIKRVLHIVNNIRGIDFLRFTLDFFGYDFILSQDDKFIQEVIESNLYVNGGMMSYDKDFTKKEKNNSFEVFKQVLRGEVDINTYYDHFMMFNRLRQFEPVKWTSTDYDSFTNEHMALTEKISFYTKGTLERIYNEEFVNRVQEPINIDGIIYYPMLLRTSDEYNMESFIQSNCVKGYVDKPSAVIISLREGSQDSKVRATIEFNISENLNTENEVKLKRTQTLGRFNKSLGDEWKKPLMMLDLKVGKLILYKLFDLPKVILSIGYKEFKSDSHFVENHYSSYDGYVNNPNRHLSWVDSRINNRPSRIMNDALPLINNDLNF
jgi:hypothetical protein